MGDSKLTVVDGANVAYAERSLEAKAVELACAGQLNILNDLMMK